MMRRPIPRFVKVIAAVALVLAVVVTVAAFEISDALQNRRDDDCERSVTYRDDNRAMWLYLLSSQDVDPKDPKVVAFETELNKRLPPLTCVDGVLTPVR